LQRRVDVPSRFPHVLSANGSRLGRAKAIGPEEGAGVDQV
jgi:hypothetical protein